MTQHGIYDSRVAEARDHYRVLGVAPDADAEAIRSAHRRLVRVLHPDRHIEATPAEKALADRRMREINDAWNTLRDPERRRRYDSTLRLLHGSPQSSDAPTGTPGSRPGRPATSRGAQSASTRAGGRSTAGSWTGPGSSASAGRGAYWHSNGAGGSRGQGAGSASDHAEDGVAVTPAAAFLLRRGPIVVIVVIVLGLFVVTAYVGGDGETREVQPPPLEACARVVDGSRAIVVPCEAPNDGRIVAQVAAALDCPPEAPRYVTVGTEFFCIPKPEPLGDGG